MDATRKCLQRKLFPEDNTLAWIHRRRPLRLEADNASAGAMAYFALPHMRNLRK
jgi:hypothetical protein